VAAVAAIRARVFGLMSPALFCNALDMAWELSAFRTALDLTLEVRFWPKLAASRVRPTAALRLAPRAANERCALKRWA
jgi:hypothetical protein